MKRAELIDYVEKARFIDLYAAEQMGESVITVYRAIGGAIQIGADNLIVRRTLFSIAEALRNSSIWTWEIRS